MGGLDLCYGRYDTKNHKLYDDEIHDIDHGLFPGLDYSNVRVDDFTR